MRRTLITIAVMAALILGATGALLIDWPSLPGSCDATWSRCVP